MYFQQKINLIKSELSYEILVKIKKINVDKMSLFVVLL